MGRIKRVIKYEQRETEQAKKRGREGSRRNVPEGKTIFRINFYSNFFRHLRDVHGLIGLCCTPRSIFSPFPYFAILLFAISYTSEITSSHLYILATGITVSLLSSFASNLWNHANDIKEDLMQQKKTVLTSNSVSRRVAMVISSILYGISVIMVLYVSIKSGKPVYLFFSVWVIITWWYSDNIFFRRLFGFRLKTHYIGEILTYGIAYPSYTLTIWLIYSDLNYAGIALATAFTFLGISGVLLKDIKDISGDRKAGLKTLGVVFAPSRLIYISCIFLMLYYLIIFNSISLKIFTEGMILVIIPFVWFVKDTLYHFHKKNWVLEFKDIKPVRTMMMSTYLSLVVLGFGAFF